MGNKTGTAGQNAVEVLRDRYYGTISKSGKLLIMGRSWGAIAKELGLPHSQRAALCQIANGKREPSRRIIERMNKVYGTAFVFHSKAVMVAPLPCGHAPSGKRCPVCNPAPKYAVHPVMRHTEIARRIDALHFSPEIRREIRAGLIG